MVMMRAFLSILFSLLGTAAVALIGLRAVGVDAHTRLMLMAAGVCLLASVMGMVPLLLTGGAGSVAVSQAGLAGLAIHMLAAAAGGGALYILLHPSVAFLYWLLGFYWATLVVVAIAGVKAVKSAAGNEAASKR